MLALGADPTPPGTPAGKFWTRVRAHKDSGFAARREEMPGMPSIEWVQAARTTRQQYRAPPRFDGVCAVLLAHSALRKPIGSALFGKRSYAPQPLEHKKRGLSRGAKKRNTKYFIRQMPRSRFVYHSSGPSRVLGGMLTNGC